MQQLPPDSGKMTEKYQRTFSNKLVLKLKNATTAPRWRFLNCINRLHLHIVLSTKGKVVYKKLEYSIFNKKFLPTISNLPTVGSAVGWCIQRLGLGRSPEWGAPCLQGNYMEETSTYCRVYYWLFSRLRRATLKISVVSPNKLNLDPDPEFKPNYFFFK